MKQRALETDHAFQKAYRRICHPERAKLIRDNAHAREPPLAWLLHAQAQAREIEASAVTWPDLWC